MKHYSILNMSHPMAAARIVRIDKCAWPGAYQMMLVTTDGGLLCPKCVAQEWGQISYAHRHNMRDGWQPAGYTYSAEWDEPQTCDHCGETFE